MILSLEDSWRDILKHVQNSLESGQASPLPFNYTRSSHNALLPLSNPKQVSGPKVFRILMEGCLLYCCMEINSFYPINSSTFYDTSFTVSVK